MTITNIKALVRAHSVAEKFRAAKQWKPGTLAAFSQTPKAKGTSEASLYIYQVIGFDWWTGEGVTADDVAKALDSVKGAKTLNVYINSEGGDVMQAKAIYSNLKRFDAQKVMHIDGVAASAATLIMLAGDIIKASQVATIMIHEAWGGAMGDAAELRSYADVLDMQNADLASLYAKKTGKTEEEMRALMAAETWMNASQALEMKLIDEMSEDDEDTEDPEAKAKAKLFPMVAAAERTQKTLALTQTDRMSFIAASLKAKTEHLTTPGKPGNQRQTGKPAGALTKQN